MACAGPDSPCATCTISRSTVWKRVSYCDVVHGSDVRRAAECRMFWICEKHTSHLCGKHEARNGSALVRTSPNVTRCVHTSKRNEVHHEAAADSVLTSPRASMKINLSLGRCKCPDPKRAAFIYNNRTTRRAKTVSPFKFPVSDCLSSLQCPA